jgi:hypothetical protein
MSYNTSTDILPPPCHGFTLDANRLTEEMARRGTPIIVPEPPLVFTSLTPRGNANLVVLHSQQGHDYPMGLDIYSVHHECRIPKPYGRGWAGIGYHIWVELAPPAGQPQAMFARPPWAIGAANLGVNSTAISICVGGDARNRPWTTLEVAIIQHLLCSLADASRIPLMWCYHRDLLTCDTNCPGKYAPSPAELSSGPTLPPYGPSKYPNLFRHATAKPR